MSDATMQKTNPIAILAIVCVSYVMIIIDTSIVITALPKLERDLGFTSTDLSWVQSAYTLTFGGLLLLGARAGDILGRRRMFAAGLLLFTLASMWVGLAQSAASMIGGRALQGIGAAVLAPSTLALLTTSFAEGPRRTRAIAYYGATAGIGACLGLPLGGIVAEALSWRVGFFINLPIGLALIAATYRYIDESDRQSGKFDVAGALTSTFGMTALVFGIVRSASEGWHDAATLAAIGIGAVLLAAFVAIEWRAPQPIMPLRLFTNRERVGAYLARIMFLGAMIGFFFFTTQFMQSVRGFTSLQAGLGFVPMTLTNFIVALAVPRLTKWLGNGRLLALGFAVASVGMGWLSRLDGETTYWVGIALPMILIGAGQGCTLSPLTASGIAAVLQKDAGAASGVVNVAHQVGNSLGLSVLVTIFAAANGQALSGADLLAHRVSATLTAGSIMLALALAIVLLFVVRRPAPRTAMQPIELEPSLRTCEEQ